MSPPRTRLTGLGLVESPHWHDGRLYFSDWTAGEVIALALDGTHEVVARVGSLPLCTARDADGRLLIVDSARGLLLRQEPDGSLVTRADLSGLGRHWNDIAVAPGGHVYVNRIGFAMGTGEAFAPGTVVHVAPDGSARQVAGDIAFPNGMAVTPDGATLIVADSYGNRLTAFAIEPDGSLSGRRVWADTGDDHPDGVCLDAEGAVWYADVGTQRCVRVREGGEVLQTIEVDRGCFACALGGPDGRTLFILAARWRLPEMVPPGTGQVLSAEVAVPAAVRP
ncbi:gluconolaconase [Sphaerisporangium krabiense]|uniref:Sugar lactone lactonase YvrE n=1 Tax=Sphaerisporangium krabiense TaxID=763782 RepID=A0A7W8Z3D1_9ACTN|nr:SMP-30/gluconolactonase/LRE family protein [Sphaerisporangium krabiense]MBB5626718.1 sugar lactone lactonase YvrE [Sphaerisporangium krabiense]GII63637.1 gluconolaconase [Sphaerisporangium krabiense]